MRALLCFALGVALVCSSVQAGDEPGETFNPFAQVRDAVNGELGDVARALRSIDQSYSYRGMRGTGAWTAGSAYMDWHAQGIPPEERWQVQPPPELDLSGYSSCCPHCGIKPRCGEAHVCRTQRVEEVICRPCLPVSWNQLPEGLVSLYTGEHCQWEPVVYGEVETLAEGLRLNSGYVHLTGASAQLVYDAQRTNAIQFSVQLALREPTAEFAPIVQLGDEWSQANLCLGQLGHTLRLRLRTSQVDTFGSHEHEIHLGALEMGEHVVAVSFCNNVFKVVVDGQEHCIAGVAGKFCNWTQGGLYLGDPARRTTWSGTLRQLELGCTNCRPCCQ